MEAGAGIEPASEDLQSSAWPLCYPAIKTKPGKTDVFPGEDLERERRLELPTSTLARLRSTN